MISNFKGLFVFALVLAILAFRQQGSTVTAPALTPHSDIRFNDVSRELGVNFAYKDPVLKAGPSSHFSPEHLKDLPNRLRLLFYAPGVAVADFNGDGWMDLFLPNANGKNALYLNRRGRRLVDRSEEWGIGRFPESIAASAANIIDIDNDGRPDVYVTGLGCARLYRNLGNRFEDISESSGTGDCRNASGAVPFDFNGDRLLDLYVMRYFPEVDILNLATNLLMPINSSDATGGGRDTLYRNLGGGRFKDVSAEAGLDDERWTLAGAVADLTGSGKPDLFLANDFGRDQVYRIHRTGKLTNESALLGPPDRSFGMDVSFGDLHHDSRPSVFISNVNSPTWSSMENFLWHFDRQKNSFVNEARPWGVAGCGGAWGAAFGDFNLDGEQDLIVVNGYISGSGSSYWFKQMVFHSLPEFISSRFDLMPSLRESEFEGHQMACLFRNDGQQFNQIRLPDLTDRLDKRSVALIDLDNDGRLDLIITSQNGTQRVLRNNSPPQGGFLGLRLEATTSQRDAIGARVHVRQRGRDFYRWNTGGLTGFQAFSDPRLHFGLPATDPVDVEISWPNGKVERHSQVKLGHYYLMQEGSRPFNEENRP